MSEEAKADLGLERTRLSRVQERFHYIKKVGHGPYSDVYHVVKDDTHYGLKVMAKNNLGNDYIERFWLEASILSSLNHPGIIRFHDAFTDNDSLYLLTELLSGGGLLDYILERGAFSEVEAAAIIRSMLETIKYLHDSNYVHLDISMHI